MVDETNDFLGREGRLSPSDAAVALLVLEDGRYLMQLRDQKPGIFFPGHWGLFGGAIESGERPEEGLRRELNEELGIDVGAVSYFTKLTIDFAPHGQGSVERHYYEVRVSQSEVQAVTLGEGAAMQLFDGLHLLQNERVTPYDALAVWLHLTRIAPALAR